MKLPKIRSIISLFLSVLSNYVTKKMTKNWNLTIHSNYDTKIVKINEN